MELAERLNEIMDKFDHYGYLDNDGDVGHCKWAIENNPTAVIEYLVDLLKHQYEMVTRK